MKRIKLNLNKFALVDDSDFLLVKDFKWYFNPYKNSVSAKMEKGIKNRRRIYLHRLIINPKKGMEVDHINGNGCDNRRKNLRICTHSENLKNQKIRINNTCGFKGAYYMKSGKRPRRWMAAITVNGKQKYLGYFSSAVEAGRAYNIAAAKYFKSFAAINII
jgi:hypothetical protein